MFFFMLSAFGITRSYLKKGESYLKNILTKKIPILYFTFVFINLIYLIVNIISGNAFDFWGFVSNALGFNLPLIGRDSWFIVSIIFLYILFAVVLLCTKKLKERNYISLGIIFAVIVILFILSIVFAPDLILVRSILCFPVGMVYAMFYKQMTCFLKRFWILVLVLAGVVIFTDFAFGFLEDQVRSLVACIFVITLVCKVNIKTQISYFIGVISLEVYLLQALVQQICAVWLLPYGQNTFTLVSLLITLLVSFAVYYLIFGVQKLIKLFWMRRRSCSKYCAKF